MVDLGARLVSVLARPVGAFIGTGDDLVDLRDAVTAKPHTYDDLLQSNLIRTVAWLEFGVGLLVACFLLSMVVDPLGRWLSAGVDVVMEAVIASSLLSGVWSAVKVGIGSGGGNRQLAHDHSLRRRLATPGNGDLLVIAVLVPFSVAMVHLG